MCSAYLSRPLRTEEQAIIDLIRSGAYAVVPKEPTTEMLQDGRAAALRVRIGGVCGMTVEAQTKAECAREDAAWRAMVARGAITLTDRQKEVG